VTDAELLMSFLGLLVLIPAIGVFSWRLPDRSAENGDRDVW